MIKIPPKTGEQAKAVLCHWSANGGFDINTAVQFCPLLARAGLSFMEDRGWIDIDMPMERLTALSTALCSSPVTAQRVLTLINEDRWPMRALTGEGFTHLNWVLGDKP